MLESTQNLSAPGRHSARTSDTGRIGVIAMRQNVIRGKYPQSTHSAHTLTSNSGEVSNGLKHGMELRVAWGWGSVLEQAVVRMRHPSAEYLMYLAQRQWSQLAQNQLLGTSTTNGLRN